LGYVLARSFHSHASFQHINGGGLASQALICRRLRRKQPERYMKFGLEMIEKIEKNNT
jgi:hypothetical protein